MIRRPTRTTSNPALKAVVAPIDVKTSKEQLSSTLKRISEAVPDTESSYLLLRRLIYDVVIPKSRAISDSINDETGAPNLAVLNTALNVLLSSISSKNSNRPLSVLPSASTYGAVISTRTSSIKEAYSAFCSDLADVCTSTNVQMPSFDSVQ